MCQDATTPLGGQHKFGWSKRLHGQRVFSAVFESRCRKHVGPLTIYSRPNTLGHCRLGLSVSRKVGSAVRRNRIKRLVREAFRLRQHDLSGSGRAYDLVVVVRPHDPAKLKMYQDWLVAGVESLHRQWQRRQKPGQSRGPDGQDLQQPVEPPC